MLNSKLIMFYVFVIQILSTISVVELDIFAICSHNKWVLLNTCNLLYPYLRTLTADHGFGSVTNVSKSSGPPALPVIICTFVT